MAVDSRPALQRDWRQGEYIEGSVLEGRIDWDALEEMEAHAIDLLEQWVEHYDRMFLAWSGGVDSLVCKHLIYQADLQSEIPAVTAITPEFYPSVVELSRTLSDRMDFEFELLTTSFMDLDWLVENAEEHLFPDFDTKQWQMDRGFRSSLEEYADTNEMQVMIGGNRNEHNHTPSYLGDNVAWLDSAIYGAPIRTWSFEHVIAYCDKYDLPISPAYNASPTSGGGPWHRRMSVNSVGSRVETPERAWYRIRDFLLNYGHAGFWERITEPFPEAEEHAAVYAARNDLPNPPVEVGYERGCDTDQFPPEIGPGV